MDDETETDLAGATTLPEMNAWPSTPGEFAARWNAATEEERTDRLNGQIDASERSLACLLGDHVNHIARAEFAQTTAEARAAEAEAVIAEAPAVLSGMIDDSLFGGEDWTYAEVLSEFEKRLRNLVPSAVLARVKADAREASLREAAASIVEGAPPINAELNPATGAQDNDELAAYIEGLHTAHAAVMALVQIDDQAKAANWAGADHE